MRSEALRWATRGAALALGVALVAGLLWLAFTAGRVIVLVFVAVLLAAALEPAVDRIRTSMRLGRRSAILVVYAAFLAGVTGLALLVVPAAFTQLDAIIDRLPALLDGLRDSSEDLRPEALRTSVQAVIGSAEEALRPAQAPDAEAVVRAGMTVAEAVVAVVTLLTVVFFWLLEHARLQRYALAFLPAHRRPGARAAWNDVATRLGLWVRGQLILMGSMGIATGLAYAVLGVPSALLLAVIAALAEAIPIVGPLIGAVPAILVASTVSTELALVVAAIYVGIQIIEGNLLVPLVMRNTIGLSPFMVLVSLLVGTAAAGLVGAFLAVPVAASIEIVLERFQVREEPVAPDPAAIDVTPGSTAEERSTSLGDSRAG
jgi:predicted PurR-regulated permease PerM